MAWLIPFIARHTGITSLPVGERRVRIAGLGYSLPAGTMVLTLQNVSDQDVDLKTIRVRSLERQRGRIPSSLAVSWHALDPAEGTFTKPVESIIAGEHLIILLHHQHLHAWMRPGAKLRAALTTGDDTTLARTIKIGQEWPELPGGSTQDSPTDSSSEVRSAIPLTPPHE